MTPALLLALLVAAAVAVFVGWGLASRRRSLPCPVWLRWMVELDNPFTRTNRAAVIVGHLGVRPGMEVLDVGCGPGRLAVPLARAVGDGGRVVAMDIQPGMLDRAREKARAAGVHNITFVRAGVGDGAPGRDRFDRALLVTVLGEIPDRDAAMREVFDALKPGGVVSVTEVVFDPHFQRRRTVERLAAAAGFAPGPFFGNSIAYTIHFTKPGDGGATSAS